MCRYLWHLRNAQGSAGLPGTDVPVGSPNFHTAYSTPLPSPARPHACDRRAPQTHCDELTRRGHCIRAFGASPSNATVTCKARRDPGPPTPRCLPTGRRAPTAQLRPFARPLAPCCCCCAWDSPATAPLLPRTTCVARGPRARARDAHGVIALRCQSDGRGMAGSARVGGPWLPITLRALTELTCKGRMKKDAIGRRGGPRSTPRSVRIRPSIAC